MRARSVTVGLAFGLPLVLTFTLLVFVVLTDPEDCLPPNAPALNVPADPVPVSNPSATLSARVASWNTLHSNSTGRVLRGVASIAGSSDVIGLQEFNPASRRATVARAMAKRGWGMTNSNNSVQIFYDASKFKVLAQDSVKVIDVVRIEGGTAGTSIGPKSLVWVQLQDRSGGVFFVLNMHMVPDIDRKGHPRPGARKRLAVRDKQRATALSVISKLRKYGPVAWTEDSNVDNRRDQRNRDPNFDYAQMRAQRMVSNWTALGIPSYGTQTRGRRLIDKVNLTMENGRFVAQRRLGSYGSDHHAVVATIANRAAAPAGTKPVGTKPATAAPSSAALPAKLTVPGPNGSRTLSRNQVATAAAIIGQGKALKIPVRGWVVALATAFQESDLGDNPTSRRPNGDGDAGVFQQRVLKGWYGSLSQVNDIRYAGRVFFAGVDTSTTGGDGSHIPGLLDIKGWEQMSVAQAAQAVQVSAFPDAYGRHESAARALVAQLANRTDPGADAAVAGTDNCPPDEAPSGSGDVGNCPATRLGVEARLTPDALLSLRCIHQQYPSITDIGGVRADAIPDHPSGRALDLMIPNYQSAAGKAFGWKVARWLQAHQKQLGIEYVIWDNRIWNIKRDDQGWRVFRASGQGSPYELHTNHVHVTVFGHAAKPDGPATDQVAAGGAWHTPVGQPSSVGCGMGCYGGHTGQDYPSPPGTPVYAVNAGTVVRSESITSSGSCTTLPICGGTRVSYGNLIVVQLAGGGETTAWYAHLTARRVRVGDVVQSGQVIGTVGFQGNVRPAGPGGSHLHFEIRQKGTPINPLPYLRQKGIQT